MASKKRSVTKSPAPKIKKARPAKPSAETAPAAMPEGVSFANPADVELGPARGRTSAIEPVVVQLLSDLSKIAVIAVPAGKTARRVRSTLYPRIAAVLERKAAGRSFVTSIRQTKDGNLAVQITEA